MFQSEDVGDNHRHRGTVQIYRVEEPKVEPNRNRNDDIRPDTDALFCEIRQTCLRRISYGWDRILSESFMYGKLTNRPYESL